MIPIKTDDEIAGMRAAGKITAEVLDIACRAVRAGVSTLDVDQLIARELAVRGAKSASFGYAPGSQRPFPAQACISINDEVVHGIPSPTRFIGDGDVVSIDLVVAYEGFMGDSTRTVIVGEVSPRVAQLVHETEVALYQGIAQ
ncbi:MAG: M24 family metallopeptidase, partial [Puniceicoccales bacterium]|nr:M24 family metallopeptidase [Puniceicoccales bacterium]